MEKKNKRKWTALDYVLFTALCVGVVFGGLLPLTLHLLIESPKDRAQAVTEAVEELMPKVPELKDFVVENLELFEEVEEILYTHDFKSIFKTENSVAVDMNDEEGFVDLVDTEIFTEDEKEKIVALFADDSPVYWWYSSMELFYLEPDEYTGKERARLYISHTRDDALETHSHFTFYMEEAAKEWYINIDPKGIVDRALKDLQAYDEYVKSKREDGGIVRLPE